jgi:voltage-gated potassium channel
MKPVTDKESFREKLHEVIFATNTREGQWFDMVVTFIIVLSVCVVVLETVAGMGTAYQSLFYVLEWVFTILFTIEFFLRLYAAHNRWRYVTSFFGIVDLLAVIPTYIGIFLPGHQSLLIIRILRLLRIFRIFELGHFVSEGAVVASALKASKIKIIVFLSFVGISSILMGALMYMVESSANPKIQNIPEGIYWAIVTITTVGYGDVLPITTGGKVLASVVMILGYGVIAVPTGIVTAEITNRVLGHPDTEKIDCPKCGTKKHLKGSLFCHHCGESIV